MVAKDWKISRKDEDGIVWENSKGHTIAVESYPISHARDGWMLIINDDVRKNVRRKMPSKARALKVAKTYRRLN